MKIFLTQLKPERPHKAPSLLAVYGISAALGGSERMNLFLALQKIN
jgi:hypothetical protein